MRLLVAWGVLIVGALVSAFVVPVVIDEWAASTAQESVEGINLGSSMAQGLAPTLKMVAQWFIPIALFFLGVKLTAEVLIRPKK